VIKLSGPAVKRWGWKNHGHRRARAEIYALMRTVPRGRVTTINDLRGALAKKHRVESACPITTGIFSWIRRTRRTKTAAARRKENHTLLAHAEERRGAQREISRRHRARRETETRRRGPRVRHQR